MSSEVIKVTWRRNANAADHPQILISLRIWVREQLGPHSPQFAHLCLECLYQFDYKRMIAMGAILAVYLHLTPHLAKVNEHPIDSIFVKFFLSSNLITMQHWLLFLVCMHVGGPKKLGNAGSPPLRMGRGWPPREMALVSSVILPNLVALGQTVWASVRRSTEKWVPEKWVPQVSSFKVTQGYRNWHESIGNLWLPNNDSQ